jgi:hypothetical protein
MEVDVKTTSNVLFPQPVSDLLAALSLVGFFKESMLIGSWVMSLYQESYGISYVLRTMDIDFAVQLLKGRRCTKIDLPGIIASHGFTSFFTQSGIQKFSREGFTIEFIAHRRGGRDEDPVFLREWNITAIPIPFVNILTDNPFLVKCPGYTVMAPVPEAFFLQKLVIATRRREQSKRAKDLEQCAVILPKLDLERLRDICGSMKLSSKTWSAVRLSCEEIGFSAQLLGAK